jgi:hypothetical protein
MIASLSGLNFAFYIYMNVPIKLYQILTILFFLILTSCSDEIRSRSTIAPSEDTQSEEPESDAPPQESNTNGVFQANLASVNYLFSPASGGANVKIEYDNLTTEIEIANASTTVHAQHIHFGQRCPTDADDTNGDGIIDDAEASAVYGGVILELDDNLDELGAQNFPNGGIYTYSNKGLFSQILINLGLQTLDLESRVVDIHGISESVTLPETAQGGKSALPVACGVLLRVSP